VQKRHVVSDQSFDSCVMLGKGLHRCILSSRRMELEASWDSWPLVANIASSPSEALALFGVCLGLCGFIMQFQGLRGMNWSASIAQFVCIFLMTVLRALVRHVLIITPICKKVPDQHEMDWLALRVATEDKDDNETGSCDFWSKNGKEFEPMTVLEEDRLSLGTLTSDHIPANFQNLEGARNERSEGNGSSDYPKTVARLSWCIYPDPKNYTYPGYSSSQQTGKAQLALRAKQRLGKLTKWISKTSKISIAVCNINRYGNGYTVFLSGQTGLSGGFQMRAGLAAFLAD